MTFCLGIKVNDGLVGIADTRVMAGTEFIVARKLSVYQRERQSMFVMTSGLRSVRDKVITYFEEHLEQSAQDPARLFHRVNALADQVRRVALEDREYLADSGLPFDFYALVGGQLENDQEHKLYLLYPQGNWVEISAGTPYHIIGAMGYGKPVLVRALTYDDPLQHALKVAFLAFDSTRISAADVDFPADVVLYRRDSFAMLEHRYDRDELRELSNSWQEKLRRSVGELDTRWMETLISRLSPIS